MAESAEQAFLEVRVARENWGELQRTVLGKGRRKRAENAEEENEPKCVHFGSELDDCKIGVPIIQQRRGLKLLGWQAFKCYMAGEARRWAISETGFNSIGQPQCRAVVDNGGKCATGGVFVDKVDCYMRRLHARCKGATKCIVARRI